MSESKTMQTILFAPFKDGTQALDHPRPAGRIEALEGRKDVGILHWDAPPSEPGVYFVVRETQKNAGRKR